MTVNEPASNKEQLQFGLKGNTCPSVFATESPMKHSKLDHSRLGQVKSGARLKSVLFNNDVS